MGAHALTRRIISFTAAIGLAGALVLGALAVPAAAADCPEPVVEFLGIGAANITLAEGGPGFTGQVTIRVFCDLGGGATAPVLDAQVRITSNVPNTTFDGQTAFLSTPAIIDLPTGSKTIIVTSTDPGLAPGQAFARVGGQTAVATLAFGRTIPDGYAPSVNTNVFARTPELSSIALLASGGVGAAGYLLVAARARRRRR
jgi:hypothetical protein